MKKKVFLFLGIAFPLIVVCCSTIALIRNSSPYFDCCPVSQIPLRPQQVPRYPQGAEVTVYVDTRTGFSGPERQAIKNGIENWNNQANNTAVSFTVVETDNPPALPPTSPGSNIVVAGYDDNVSQTGVAGLKLFRYKWRLEYHDISQKHPEWRY